MEFVPRKVPKWILVVVCVVLLLSLLLSLGLWRYSQLKSKVEYVLTNQVARKLKGNMMVVNPGERVAVYEAFGVVGEVIQKPFGIYSVSGQKLGISKLAYKHVFLDSKYQLAMRIVPVVVEDNNGGVITGIGDWKKVATESGFTADVTGLIRYYSNKLVIGKKVSFSFFDSNEGLEQYLKAVEGRRGVPIEMNSDSGRKLNLIRQSLEGRTGRAESMRSGKENGGLVIPLGFSSLMYGQWQTIQLPNNWTLLLWKWGFK